MLTIEETKNCKFWRLINSAAKNIESLNIKQSKKQELYSNLYEIEDINKKLLESAEKGLEYIQNGIEFRYISPDQESETPELLRKAINKAKGDGENDKNIIAQCKIFEDPELGPNTIDIWKEVRKKEGKNADEKFKITGYNVLSRSEEENRVLVRVNLKTKGDGENERN
jgi:hypothetical protein